MAPLLQCTIHYSMITSEQITFQNCDWREPEGLITLHLCIAFSDQLAPMTTALFNLTNGGSILSDHLGCLCLTTFMFVWMCVFCVYHMYCLSLLDCQHLLTVEATDLHVCLFVNLSISVFLHCSATRCSHSCTGLWFVRLISK